MFNICRDEYTSCLIPEGTPSLPEGSTRLSSVLNVCSHMDSHAEKHTHTDTHAPLLSFNGRKEVKAVKWKKN